MKAGADSVVKRRSAGRAEEVGIGGAGFAEVAAFHGGVAREERRSEAFERQWRWKSGWVRSSSKVVRKKSPGL